MARLNQKLVATCHDKQRLRPIIGEQPRLLFFWSQRQTLDFTNKEMGNKCTCLRVSDTLTPVCVLASFPRGV